MQYLGGKARVAKWLHGVLAPLATGRTTYLEPFLGGGNAFKYLNTLCPVVCASDSNKDLMVLWEAISAGWVPPVSISREQYKELQTGPLSPLKTFAGFGCSFGGKWFAGYAANARGDDYCGASRRNLLSLQPALKKATLRTGDYRQWRPRDSWLVYCDPPYENTEQYSTGGFDHADFWATCREWGRYGAAVYVSEYQAPEDFVCIAEKATTRTLSAQDDNRRVVMERVFAWSGGLK